MHLDVTNVIGAMIIAIFVLGGCNATNLIDGLDGLPQVRVRLQGEYANVADMTPQQLAFVRAITAIEASTAASGCTVLYRPATEASTCWLPHVSRKYEPIETKKTQ